MEGIDRNPLIRKDSQADTQRMEWTSKPRVQPELQSFWQSIAKHSEIAKDSFVLDSLKQLESSCDDAPLSVPEADVFESPTAIFCYVNLPGCDPTSLQVVVRPQVVRMSGFWGSPQQDLSLGWSMHRQERPRGRFAKTIQLPEVANIEELHCVFEAGVLRLRIGKYLDS